MSLDTRGEVFQNLNGALEEVKVKYKSGASFLYNFKTGMIPAVVHGNGPIKVRGRFQKLRLVSRTCSDVFTSFRTLGRKIGTRKCVLYIITVIVVVE